MAETATRPTRTRAARPAKAAPAKAAPVAAAKAAEATEVKDGNVERLVIPLEYVGDTKSYAKFAFPEGSACVGTVYAPLGTKEVRVAMKGSAE